MECGPACLLSIVQYYGRVMALPKLTEKCFTTKEGSSLLNLSYAAESIGFHTVGVMISWPQLCDEAFLPCIVHWNQNHFIVVYKIEKHRGKWYVYVSDPAAGLLKYTEEQFLKSWLEIKGADGQPDKGVALLLEPTPAFYEQHEEGSGVKEERKFTLRHLLKYLKPHRQSIV